MNEGHNASCYIVYLLSVFLCKHMVEGVISLIGLVTVWGSHICSTFSSSLHSLSESFLLLAKQVKFWLHIRYYYGDR